jgi:hypothetical protein
MPKGVDLIAIERRRQMTAEGWTSEHDDQHDDGSLANAAAVYAMRPDCRMLAPPSYNPGLPWSIKYALWPMWWNFKPTPRDRIRELVKAGALVAAEIDRLQRLDEGGDHA